MTENNKRRVFIDMIRVIIGLDPLYCTLTYQEVVQGFNRGSFANRSISNVVRYQKRKHDS